MCHVRDELGFDDCIDYKAVGFDERLKQACPEGIDIYFENVGGAGNESGSTHAQCWCEGSYLWLYF